MGSLPGLREAPVARRAAEDVALAAPVPITPKMVTEAYCLFVTECAKVFPLHHDLVAGLTAAVAAAEQQGLPLGAHLRACDRALQQLIGSLPSDGREDIMDEIAEVLKHVVRLHSLGMCLFHSLLYELLDGLDLGPVEAILSPGCGQFFEAAVLDALFAPRTIIGQDTNDYALMLGLKHNQNIMSVLLQNVDSARRPVHTTPDIDMTVFIHPNILDPEHWGGKLESMVQEFETLTPLETLRDALSTDAMSQVWKTIVATAIARLRRGGRLVFVFYELREQELMRYYLETLHGTVAVERLASGPGATTFLYVEPPELDDPRYKPESYDWIVMRNYHHGLVARKL